MIQKTLEGIACAYGKIDAIHPLQQLNFCSTFVRWRGFELAKLSTQQFGSPDTNLKLDKLTEYLDRFTTALQFQPSREKPFRKIYFDAFAGNGGIDIVGESMPLFDVYESTSFIKGSARRALELKVPFDEYIFVEKDKTRARELQAMVASEYSNLASRVRVINGDANKVLQEFCQSHDWYARHSRQSRAVVFLDPFGNNVVWDTIKCVAQTKAIDLWYLFPAGLGVNRQVGNDGKIHYTHEASIDALFGGADWQELARQPTGQLSFDNIPKPAFEKLSTPKIMTEFMIKRMKPIFGGGVLDDWLPLGGKGRHDYSLLFAWANPSPKAKLAPKLAAAVLRRKK